MEREIEEIYTGRVMLFCAYFSECLYASTVSVVMNAIDYRVHLTLPASGTYIRAMG